MHIKWRWLERTEPPLHFIWGRSANSLFVYRQCSQYFGTCWNTPENVTFKNDPDSKSWILRFWLFSRAWQCFAKNWGVDSFEDVLQERFFCFLQPQKKRQSCTQLSRKAIKRRRAAVLPDAYCILEIALNLFWRFAVTWNMPRKLGVVPNDVFMRWVGIINLIEVKRRFISGGDCKPYRWPR